VKTYEDFLMKKKDDIEKRKKELAQKENKVKELAEELKKAGYQGEL